MLHMIGLVCLTGAHTRTGVGVAVLPEAIHLEHGHHYFRRSDISANYCLFTLINARYE